MMSQMILVRRRKDQCGRVGGKKTSGTPWKKLPSSGPFALAGMRKARQKQYTHLERGGAKFHLKTREQSYNKKIAKLRKKQRTEARKIRKKLARRAARGGADADKPPPPTPAADALAAALGRSDGLTPYQDEMRGRFKNTFHISVRAATEKMETGRPYRLARGWKMEHYTVPY